MRELKKLLTRGCRRLGVEATPRNAAILAAATMTGDTLTREAFTDAPDAPDGAGTAAAISTAPPTSIDPKAITEQVQGCVNVMVPVAVDLRVAETVPVEVAKEIAAALPGIVRDAVATALDEALGNPPAAAAPPPSPPDPSGPRRG